MSNIDWDDYNNDRWDDPNDYDLEDVKTPDPQSIIKKKKYSKTRKLLRKKKHTIWEEEGYIYIYEGIPNGNVSRNKPRVMLYVSRGEESLKPLEKIISMYHTIYSSKRIISTQIRTIEKLQRKLIRNFPKRERPKFCDFNIDPNTYYFEEELDSDEWKAYSDAWEAYSDAEDDFDDGDYFDYNDYYEKCISEDRDSFYILYDSFYILYDSLQKRKRKMIDILLSHDYNATIIQRWYLKMHFRPKFGYAYLKGLNDFNENLDILFKN